MYRITIPEDLRKLPSGDCEFYGIDTTGRRHLCTKRLGKIYSEEKFILTDWHRLKAKRLPPNIRRLLLLDDAVEYARKIGYLKLTRERVAQHCDMTAPIISHYFGSMDGLKSAIMKVAVDDGIPEIVAYGLLIDHPIALTASQELKNKAAYLLSIR